MIGAAWGLANFWCLAKAVECVIKNQKNFQLIAWIIVKFFGLYGVAGWLLIGARIPAAGWLLGFTISLVALGISSAPSLRATLGYSAHLLFALALLGATRFAYASESGGESAAGHAPEIPSLITLITHNRHGPIAHFLHSWENTIYAFVIVGIVGVLFALGARALAIIKPGRGQTFAEMVIEGVDGLVCGVLGKEEGRRYLPFLGTLFLFILSMNLAGLVPGLKSPTAHFEMTMALGACVFVFVQYTGIRRLGFIRYADHFLGEPRDIIGWILAPLMFFIHGIGEIVKPVSLALRLFGNVMGEDTLLGVFVSLGALCFAWSKIPMGVPFHLPFVLLAVIFSTVQAIVFTMLSMIYIYMMLPHEEHHAEEAIGKHHEPV